MAVSDLKQILTTTQDDMAPFVVNHIFDSNVLLQKLLSKAKKWNGERMKQPIIYKKGVAGQSFQGSDTLSTAQSDQRVNMEFEPTNYDINVTVPVESIMYNKGKAQVIDYLELEMQTRAMQMADELGDMIYGDGTGNGGKDFLGLEGIVDDSTNLATYGGLSRSTYSTLNSTVTDSSGTLTLLKMRTLWNNISSGSIQPTDIFTTEAINALYESLNEPKIRINRDYGDGSAKDMGTGSVNLLFTGIPIHVDEKCPEGNMYMLNMKYLNFYAKAWSGKFGSYSYKPVNITSGLIKDNQYEKGVKGLGFSVTDFIPFQNAHALISRIILSGNAYSIDPRRQGKLTGITGV